MCLPPFLLSDIPVGLVEDIDATRDSLRESIKTITQSVHAFREPSEVLPHWQQHPELKIWVVDLCLPDEQGNDTVEAGFRLIRQLKQRPGVVVLVHSAYIDDAGNAQRAREVGADDLIRKGSSGQILLNRLQAAFEKLTSAPPSEGPAATSFGQYPSRGSLVTEPAGLQQQRDDHDWILKQPALLRRHAGKVVALHGQTIWGVGVDHAEAHTSASRALQEAAGQPLVPSLDDLSYVVVPALPEREIVLPTLAE